MKMTKLSRRLSLRLINANTTAEIDKWVKDATDEIGGVRWLNIGNLSNNRGFCEFSGSSGAALVERVTNAKDAILEWLKCHNPASNPQSPHEAASTWLPKWLNPDDPAPKAIEDLEREQRLKVAALVSLGVHDGDAKERPTITVRDKGIGQNPDAFKSTLLSFGNSNKVGKPYLHGKYNMGSNVSYSFANRATIVSMRHPDCGDSEGEIGAVVVKRDDEQLQRPFVYLADKNGEIIRLDLPEWEPGTEVKLVGYNIPQYCHRVNLPTHSLWQLLQSALPKPAFPFSVEEFRKDKLGDKRSGRRTVSGLVHLLKGKLHKKTGQFEQVDEDGDRDAEKESVTDWYEPFLIKVDNPAGRPQATNMIELHIFVLNDKARGDDYYVKADNHLIFALNGQRQMSRSRQWFNQIGYPALHKRIICIADCSGLSDYARAELFTSTRETERESPYTDLVIEEIRDLLVNNEDLKRLEQEAMEKSEAAAVHKSSEKAKKKLLQSIQGLLGSSGGEGEGERSPPRKKRSTDDSNLPPVPTRIAIENNPVKTNPGAKAHITLEVDAKNGYFPGPMKTLQVVSQTLPQLPIVSTGTLLGGILRLSVAVPNNAPIGSHEIIVELRDFHNQLSFQASGTMEVCVQTTNKKKPGRPKKKKGSAKPACKIAVDWFDKSQWSEKGWDEKSVGECLVHRPRGFIEKISFFLNLDNCNLARALGDKGRTEEARASVLERIAISVCPQLFAMQEAKEERSDSLKQSEKEWVFASAIQSIFPDASIQVIAQNQTRKRPTKNAARVAVMAP
jgi:hypothetical protein